MNNSWTHADAYASCLRTETHKLVRYHTTDEGELYDLESDPIEQTNLFESQPDTAERMRTLLIQFERSMQRSIQGLDYPEKTVNAGEPQPRSWTNVPEYKPYFEQWKNRPEYKSRLKNK